MKKRTIDWKDILLITLGTAIAAAAVHFFLVPSNLTVGSIAALALVVSKVVPLPISVLTLIFNLILLLVGFLIIGPDFGAKSVYGMVLLSVFLRLLELLFPDFQSLTQDPLLDMICYVLLVSVGLAILFVHNSSSGGLDVVAKLLNRFLRMDMGKAMSVSGMCVALSAAFFFDAKTVVLSVIGTYFNGIVVDNFCFGMNAKKRVCIISEKFEEIKDYVLYELHSGATVYQAVGAFDNCPRKELIVIVDKSEFSRLRIYLEKKDPEAFVTVYTVSEVNCRPKQRLEAEIKPVGK